MNFLDTVEPEAEQPEALIEAQPEPAVVPATVEPATVVPATVEPATVVPATVEPAKKPPKIKLPSASTFLADKLAEARSIEDSVFSLTDYPTSSKSLSDLTSGGNW